MMRRSTFCWLAASLVMFVLVATAPATRAQSAECTISWVNPAGGGWDVASNWSSKGVPTASDRVCIGDLNGSTYEVVLSGSGTRAIASLRLGASTGTQTLRLTSGVIAPSGDVVVEPTGVLDLGDGRHTFEGEIVIRGVVRTGSNTFTFNGPVSIEAGGRLKDLSGWTNNYDGGLTIQAGGVYEWSGGVMTGTAEMVNHGVLEMTGTDPNANYRRIGQGSTFRNYGAIEYGGGRFALENEATLINETAGLFDIQGDFDVLTWNSAPATLINRGTFRKSAGTDESGVLGAVGTRVENTGVIEALAGRLRVGGGPHTDAVFNVSAGAELILSGSGAPYTPNELVGTLTGDVQGTLTIRASTVSDDATLDLDGTGTVLDFGRIEGQLTNAGYLTVQNGLTLSSNTSFTNTGEVAYVGGGWVQFESPGSVFVNEVGATFDMQFDGFFRAGTAEGNNAFHNRGSFVKSGGTGITTVTAVPQNGGSLSFNNSGTVRAETGTIQFGGDVINAHANPTFTALAGAKVEFRAGTHIINGTMRGDPEGTVSLTRATITGGVIDMGGTGLEWQQGGSFLYSTTNRGVVRTTGGFASRIVPTGETLTNEGVFRIEGAGVVLEGFGSRFVNAAGAVYDLATGSSIGVESPADNVAFDNYGTILSSEGNGSPTFNRVEVVNHPGSVVRLEDGGLKFSGGFDLREGAVLEGVGSVEFASSGTTLLDGLISPGLSPGVLTLSYFSTFNLDPGTTIRVEIAGTGGPGAPDGHDQLVLPAAETTLDGILEIEVIGDPTLSIGDTFRVLDPRFNGTIVGTFSKVIQSPGYTFDVTYGEGDDGVTLTLVGLGGQTGEVSGQITADGNGLPVEEAYVQFWAEGDDGPEVRAWAQTDASGHYRRELSAGSYRVFAFAANHTAGWYDNAATYEVATPVVVAAGAAVLADFALAPTAPGAIAGTLTDAVTGIPISGLLVRAWKRSLPAVTYDTRTGPDGAFLLDSALPGDYTLRFFDPLGRYPGVYYGGAVVPGEAVPISVAPGQTASASAALAPTDVPIVVRGVWSSTPGPNGTIEVVGFRRPVGPLSISSRAGCSDDSVPESVDLVLEGGARFEMEEDPAGSQWYTVTLQVPDDTNSQIGRTNEVRALCNGQEETVGILSVGRRLYDPAGQITDAETGLPVEGAVVQLYRVPSFRPETVDDPEGTVGVCETTETREGGVWSQPAPVALGVGIDVATSDSLLVSPLLNVQLTSSEGRYAWDVAEGCWYVTVTASGYLPLTSPVVGVPPPVLDLDLALTPDGAAAPEAVALPALLAFGEVGIGTSVVRPFVVRNAGRAPLSVQAASLIGPDAGAFALEGFVAFTVAPGEVRAVAVAFRPTAIGNRAAALRLETDDPNASQLDVGLRGSAMPSADAEAPATPTAFALGAAYPNPVAGLRAATFPLDIPVPSETRLTVYDARGRVVAVLVDGLLPAGRHAATLEGTALSAGVYVVEMRAGAFVQSRRVTIVR